MKEITKTTKEELLDEIDSFIETFDFRGSKYAPGEITLSKRSVFEIYLNTLLEDTTKFSKLDKEYLFREIVKREALFPIPYTTNNFKKVHYFANVVRNVANIIFRDCKEKEIKIDVLPSEPIFKDFFTYIRSNNEEGGFIYRNSVFDMETESLEETKIEKDQISILTGSFISSYVKMSITPTLCKISVVKLPIKKTKPE